MSYKQVAEMNPWTDNGNNECPFDCVGCPHLVGINFNSNTDIDIECDLED